MAFSPDLVLWFVLLGFIGGVAHVVVDAKEWEDLKKFSSFKQSILGAICGFIYCLLYSEYSFPNTVMTFVSGYMGTDFMLKIIEKFQTRGGGNS